MAGQPSSTSGAGKSPCKARPNDGTLILPLARIKTIMKSSPDVENISSDALYHVTKATELFVEHLIQEIYSHHPKASELNYAGLADVVQTQDSLEFLKGEALTCEVTPSAVLTRHLWMQKWSRERSPSRSSTG